MPKLAGYWLFFVLWLPLGAWADASVWKLADTDIYLAGSIHVLRSSDYPLPIEYDIAYQNADRLVLETDLAAADDLRNQALVAARGIYTDGRTLSRELSDPVYARLSEYLRAKGLPPEQFELYRPWLVMLTLTMIELQANGITAQHGVDRHFYQRARRDGKPISGLEGIEVQIEALASLGGEFSDELIESQLSDMEQLPEMIDELIASWRVGDETLLNDLLMGDLRNQYPRVYDTVFRQRNRNWLEKLDGLIRSGDRVMVIVGSGHLIGEDGLIALLAERGHRFDKLDAEG
jgi:hypothetical protein